MIQFNMSQVQAQKETFDFFMANVNIDKVGRTYVRLVVEGTESGEIYRPYNYINKILSIVANVHPAMYHPEKNVFYADILKNAALSAYFNN